MISKNAFLKGIKKLEEIFDGKMTERQVELYYETLSPDFTDEDFNKQLNHVLKESFKFPPLLLPSTEASKLTIPHSYQEKRLNKSRR